jgi:hypothetical protein
LTTSRSLLRLTIEFSSDYDDACGSVVLLEASASTPRAAVPKSRLFAQPKPLGTGGYSSLLVKPAQVAAFTNNFGRALSLATAGVAAAFYIGTRDEYFNMRGDQSVRGDCATNADCTLAVRITPTAPGVSQGNRPVAGVFTLHSVNNYFDVSYTVTAAGVYSLSVAAVYRLPSGACVCCSSCVAWDH